MVSSGISSCLHRGWCFVPQDSAWRGPGEPALEGCQLSSLQRRTAAAASCDSDLSNDKRGNGSPQGGGHGSLFPRGSSGHRTVVFLSLPPHPNHSGFRGNLTQTTLLLYVIPTPSLCLSPIPPVSRDLAAVLRGHNSHISSSAQLQGMRCPCPSASLALLPQAVQSVSSSQDVPCHPSLTASAHYPSLLQRAVEEGSWDQAVPLLNPRHTHTLALQGCAAGLELC